MYYSNKLVEAFVLFMRFTNLFVLISFNFHFLSMRHFQYNFVTIKF